MDDNLAINEPEQLPPGRRKVALALEELKYSQATFNEQIQFYTVTGSMPDQHKLDTALRHILKHTTEIMQSLQDTFGSSHDVSNN